MLDWRRLPASSKRLRGHPYWLVLYGIEVWGDLPPAKVKALRGAERYLTITRFTLDAMTARHKLKEPRASILPPTLPKPRPQSPEAKNAVIDETHHGRQC